MDIPWEKIYPEAQEYLQRLIQFNTTNPPGNERVALEYLSEILEGQGIKTTLLDSGPGRANLVARLKGTGGKKPLLLAAHVDVVGADPKQWKYPPFSGEVAEGCIWGRGAVDMKTMAIYEIMALLLFVRHKIAHSRDLILALVADEEAGGDYGMKWMVDHHPDLLRAEYSFNEVGGFSISAGKKRLYPIQVGHKGAIWIKFTIKGVPGHGSMPRKDNAILRLARAVSNLEKDFPIQIHPISKAFIDNLGRASGGVARLILSLLTVPLLGKALLKILPKDKARYLSALLRNTMVPTVLRAGDKANVIPAEGSVVVDCRTLPGTDHQALKEAIAKKLGEEMDMEILYEMGPYEMKNWDTPFYKILASTIEKHDPQAVVTPSLTVGFTDAKHLEPLGVDTYGFFPMKLPEGFQFAELFHGHNERIPLESFHWGLRVFFEALLETAK